MELYVTKTAHDPSHLALARGDVTAVVLLDQLTAFDKMDHNTVLDCFISRFGVWGVVLEWFKSYLTGHSKCVNIGTILSDENNLFHLPQGSVLCYVPYILLPSAKSFVTTQVKVSTILIHS